MRFSARPLLGLVVAMSTGSCLISDSTGVGGNTSPAGLFVQPAVIPSAADATALPINRIRALAARESDGAVLADLVFTVTPTAAEWELDIDVPVGSSEVVAVLYLHLINEAADGTREIQYSGRTEPIILGPGETVEPADVPLVRGPPENLLTTGVTITSVPSTMAEGDSEALGATVTTSGTVPPTVFWTSLDETVVTLEEATVTAVAPGQVEVVASAGAFADTASIQVFGALTLDVPSLPDGVQGVGYDQQLAASGGDGVYTWSVPSGALPAGTSLDGDRIVGTPTTVGRASFTLQVASGDGQTETADLDIDVEDDAPAGFTITESGGSSQVDEGGATDDLTIVLDAQPIDDVVLSVTSEDEGEVAVEPATLTFTNANWSTGQTVTLTGVDDTVVDDDQTTAVTIGVDAAASDDRFDDLIAQSVTVVTVDDGEPVGGPQAVTWTNEAGGNWSTGNNWSTGSPPAPGDSVAIDLAGSYTVIVDQDVDVAALVVGAPGTGSTISVVQDANTVTVSDVLAIEEGGIYELGGTGTLTGAGGILVFDAIFAWSGGTLAGSGELVLDAGSYGLISGATTKPSTKPMTVDGTLEIAGGGTLDQDGLFILDANGLLQGDGTLDLTDGTIELWLGETAPGASPGQLTVVTPVGGLVMDQLSATTIEIEGTTPGTEFDVLELVGGVTLGGGLTVLDPIGFTPSAGQRWAIVTVTGSRSGDFGSITLPSVPGVGLSANWISGQTADTLQVVATDLPLVFSSDRAGNGSVDIWTASEDMSITSQLTSSNLHDQGPRWSPDGSQIVFTRFDGNTSEELIWTMDADGSNAIALSPPQSDHGYPDWSPDGSQIVFTNNDGFSDDIWIMNRDGTGATEITTEPDSDEFDPEFSPDGSQIVFVTNVFGDLDIWVMNPDGSGQTEVTTSLDDERDPTWSPDGSQIAFVRSVAGEDDIWIMDANGGNQQQLTFASGQNAVPVFSPDGSRIYFMSDRTGNFEIWVMNKDGTNPQQLTDNPAFDGGVDVRD